MGICYEYLVSLHNVYSNKQEIVDKANSILEELGVELWEPLAVCFQAGGCTWYKVSTHKTSIANNDTIQKALAMFDSVYEIDDLLNEIRNVHDHTT